MVTTREPVVVLHVGAMKTGTTFLQGKAYANREALEAAGVSLPGKRWSWQVWAVQELLGMGRSDAELVKRNAGRWRGGTATGASSLAARPPGTPRPTTSTGGSATRARPTSTS